MNSNEYILIGERVAEASTAKIDDIFAELGSTVTVEHALRIKKETGKIAARHKVNDTAIPGGYKHGLRVQTTLDDDEYIKLVNDNSVCNDGTALNSVRWVFQPPTEPAAYDPAAVNAANAAQRAQMEAAHDRKTRNYYIYFTVEEGLKQSIVDNKHLEELIIGHEDDDVGYINTTLREMLNTLITKTKQSQGTVKRAELRQSLAAAWDGTGFDKFIKRQETRKAMVEKAGVQVTDDQLVDATVLLIYEANFLDQVEIEEWENKAAADQTWANVKTYFGDIHATRNKPKPGKTAGKLGYGTEEMNALEEKSAELDVLTGRVCDVLQKLTEHKTQAPVVQHSPPTNDSALAKQLADVTKVLKTLTETVDDMKKQDGRKNRQGGKPKHKCGICEFWVWHSEEKCPDKEENKHLRRDNWKPKEERKRLGLQQA